MTAAANVSAVATSLPSENILAALSAAIACPTIADGQHEDAFPLLHEVLQEHFPQVFASCEFVDMPHHALLLRWPGANGTNLPPAVILAHQDVVPVAADDEWVHPPFSGTIADGQVWGRGAIDNKGALIGILGALEGLLRQGFSPQRDVWFSFGSDEEVMGVTAQAAVEVLQQREVEPWFVLDEGGAIVTEALPNITVPIALVGVAEKGNATLMVTASGQGGHASMPPSSGATALLAQAISRIESHPFPASMSAATVEMLERVAPYASGPMSALLRRTGSMRSALAKVFARLSPETAAMVRTTMAFTQLEASPAANVLATSAKATINMRLAPGHRLTAAVQQIRRTINDPENIAVDVIAGDEASPVSPFNNDAFALLERVTKQVAPEVVPVPFIVLAATDSRHFHQHWPNVYRFNPQRMDAETRQGIHNVNESLSVRSVLEGVQWYSTLLEAL